MYADRHSPARPDPAGIGAALALSATLFGAFLFIAPDIGLSPAPPGELHVRNIPLPPTPPPEPEAAPRRTPVTPEIVTPEPVIRTTIPDQPPIDTTPVLPEGPPLPEAYGPGTATGGSGTGPAITFSVTPTPAPVMVDARIDPRHRDAFQPDYPASERRSERDGTVTVRIRIDVRGRVTEVRQVGATSEAFWEATRRTALGRWRFTPATRDGVAVESWRTMTVHFRMEDG